MKKIEDSDINEIYAILITQNKSFKKYFPTAKSLVDTIKPALADVDYRLAMEQKYLDLVAEGVIKN